MAHQNPEPPYDIVLFCSNDSTDKKNENSLIQMAEAKGLKIFTMDDRAPEVRTSKLLETALNETKNITIVSSADTWGMPLPGKSGTNTKRRVEEVITAIKDKPIYALNSRPFDLEEIRGINPSMIVYPKEPLSGMKAATRQTKTDEFIEIIGDPSKLETFLNPPKRQPKSKTQEHGSPTSKNRSGENHYYSEIEALIKFTDSVGTNPIDTTKSEQLDPFKVSNPGVPSSKDDRSR